MPNTDNRLAVPVAERPHMPGYGIATGPEGLLPWSWAVERLDRARHFWLATTGPDGAPHLAALWAVWVDPALYFSTGEQSRKARNLVRECRCAVSVADATDAVVVEGMVRSVTDAAERSRVATAYEGKYGEGFPDDSPLYAVDPATAYGTIDHERQFTTTATRWRFPAPDMESRR